MAGEVPEPHLPGLAPCAGCVDPAPLPGVDPGSDEAESRRGGPQEWPCVEDLGVSVSSWGYPQSSSISNDGIFTYEPSSYGDIPMTMETPKSVIHCLNRPFSIHSPPKIPAYRILHHSITILIRISSCGLGWQWIFHARFQSRGGSPVHHL